MGEDAAPAAEVEEATEPLLLVGWCAVALIVVEDGAGNEVGVAEDGAVEGATAVDADEAATVAAFVVGGGYLCCKSARMMSSVERLHEEEECSNIVKRIDKALSSRKKSCCGCCVCCCVCCCCACCGSCAARIGSESSSDVVDKITATPVAELGEEIPFEEAELDVGFVERLFALLLADGAVPREVPVDADVNEVRGGGLLLVMLPVEVWKWPARTFCCSWVSATPKGFLNSATNSSVAS